MPEKLEIMPAIISSVMNPFIWSFLLNLAEMK